MSVPQLLVHVKSALVSIKSQATDCTPTRQPHHGLHLAKDPLWLEVCVADALYYGPAVDVISNNHCVSKIRRPSCESMRCISYFQAFMKLLYSKQQMSKASISEILSLLSPAGNMHRSDISICDSDMEHKKEPHLFEYSQHNTMLNFAIK